jgi:hypothetical protein
MTTEVQTATVETTMTWRALALALCLSWAAAPALAAVTGDPVGVDGGQVSGIWRENADVRARCR